MNAFKFPDGKVFVPFRVEVDGVIGDGWEVVEGDSEQAKAYAPWTIPATPDMIEMYERHKLNTDVPEKD